MSWLVCHIVSGDAFISGLLCVAAGLALIWLRRTKRGQLGGRILIVFGWLLAIAGLQPCNDSWLFLAAGWSICGLIASVLPQRLARPDPAPDGADFVRMGSLAGIIGIVLVLISSWSRSEPSTNWKPGEPIHVIGDSLSAGIGAGEGEPWPERLAAILDFEVVSHAQAGATAKSAIEQTEQLPADSFVIVEIGGNDLLGGGSSAEFEQDLDRLLTKV